MHVSVPFDAYLPNVLERGKMPVMTGGWRVSSLLTFTTWQGLAWVGPLYTLFLVLNTLFWLLIMISGYITGDVGWILFSTFIVPILWVASILTGRILMEVIVAILLLPTLLSTNYTRFRNDGGIPNNVGGHIHGGSISSSGLLLRPPDHHAPQLPGGGKGGLGTYTPNSQYSMGSDTYLGGGPTPAGSFPAAV